MEGPALMIRAKSVALVALVVGLVSASPARSEVLLTPFAGKAFSGSLDSNRTTYGAGIAFLGGGVFGFEGEFSYVKDFFGALDVPQAVDSNRVQSLSFDLMAALPTGSTRLYGSGGVSLLRPALTSRTGFVVVDEDKLGFNVGGGLMVFLSERVGLRGDLRYFRTFGALQSGDQVTLGKLDYWRGTGGLTFKF
jgi:opacity protein-like surface antigen